MYRIATCPMHVDITGSYYNDFMCDRLYLVATSSRPNSYSAAERFPKQVASRGVPSGFKSGAHGHKVLGDSDAVEQCNFSATMYFAGDTS